MTPPPAMQARRVDETLGWRGDHEISGFRCRSRVRQGERITEADSKALIRWHRNPFEMRKQPRFSDSKPNSHHCRLFSSAHDLFVVAADLFAEADDLFVGATQVATLFAVIPNARAARSGTRFFRHPREGGDPCLERLHKNEILRSRPRVDLSSMKKVGWSKRSATPPLPATSKMFVTRARQFHTHRRMRMP